MHSLATYWPKLFLSICLIWCRFCAFTWNASGMRWCTPSRSVATCPSRWRASTCSPSWPKRARLRSPPTTCSQSFATTAPQEVRLCFTSGWQALSRLIATNLIQLPCLRSQRRWTLHSLLSERHQRPVVWVWWSVCNGSPWDGGAECRGLRAVLQVKRRFSVQATCGCICVSLALCFLSTQKK